MATPQTYNHVAAGHLQDASKLLGGTIKALADRFIERGENTKEPAELLGCLLLAKRRVDLAINQVS